MAWLEGQEWWRRNNGRDHVIVAECVETGHGSGQERGFACGGFGPVKS